jgi:hypothetical protein
MGTEKTKWVAVRYVSVSTSLCNVRELSEEHPPPSDELAFEIQAEVRYEGKGFEIVLIIMGISIKDPSQEEPIAKIIARHLFHIQNMELLKKDGKYHIPRDLIARLMDTVYSTTRGLLLARSAGTSVGTLVLPMYDPMEMVRLFTQFDFKGDTVILEPEEPS